MTTSRIAPEDATLVKCDKFTHPGSIAQILHLTLELAWDFPDRFLAGRTLVTSASELHKHWIDLIENLSNPCSACGMPLFGDSSGRQRTASVIAAFLVVI